MAGQLEGDRAATAICELVVLLVADEGDSYNCYLGTGVLGGRLSLKMGYNCNLGSRGFSVAGLAHFDCNVRPGFSWRLVIELEAGGNKSCLSGDSQLNSRATYLDLRSQYLVSPMNLSRPVRTNFVVNSFTPAWGQCGRGRRII